MMRRFIAFWLAVSIGFFTVVTPARALAPLAVLSAPVFVGAGGTSWGMGFVLSAIGSVVGYMEIMDLLGNSTRIALSENPVVPIPAPVAPSTVTGTSSPNTEAINNSCQMQANQKIAQNPTFGCGSSWQAVVGETTYYCKFWYSSSTWTGAYCGDSYPAALPTPAVTCPAGYSQSGGSCALSNPRLAVSDKNCDLLPVNGKFEYNDADCPSGATIDHSKAVPGLRREGEVVHVPGTVDGKPVLLKLLLQKDPVTGEVVEQVLEYYRQVGPNVESTIATLSPAAQIKTVTQSVSPGQITYPASSPTSASAPDNATTTPQVTTDPTKAPITQFPDDYARENTMQRTATGVENLLKPTETADPTIPGSTLFDDSFFKTTFGALKGWQLPSHSSQCPTGSIDLFGAPRIINAHCTLLNDQAAQLQAAMMVVWTLLGLFIVLRA